MCHKLAKSAKNLVNIVHNVTFRYPKELHTQQFNVPLSAAVAILGFGSIMADPIDLDSQEELGTEEINDIFKDAVLTPEFESLKLTIPQVPPEDHFPQGRIST